MSEAVPDWRAVRRDAAPYAERRDEEEGSAERIIMERMVALRNLLARAPRVLEGVVAGVEAHAARLAAMDDRQFDAAVEEARRRLRRGMARVEACMEAFALVREAAGRTLGMRHFPVQLTGGWIILQGRVAEMNTGEGKTLTATLPASVMALAGVPVHVVTVNDYLASRDAEIMGPVYRRLGLSVGVVQHGQSPEERRAAYAADVTYCTNKELAFDYLRDRLTLAGDKGDLRLRIARHLGSDRRLDRLYLRGLHFAIVDEVDSVLIDEASMPLILSAGDEGAGEAGPFATALELARSLEEEADFVIDRTRRVARLSEPGKARVEQLSRDLSGAWRSERGREELATQALSALHLFERDRHYIVVEGKVQIVDEFTGRVMADRSWERGLHQMIEVKEGCEVTGRRVTQAKVTYQRFFRRYLILGGMSGTVMEVSPELWSVYRLRTVRVPTNRPVIRVDRGVRMLADSAARWAAVVESVRGEVARGRPVLIGTRSVAASEHLSILLDGVGIAHRVLNARFDSEEAGIVAEAGRAGAVTVATNMAGRGTDILLGPGVAQAGGLHVILTEFHESARIDRQLFGRSGRQGDPGSGEAIVSLEDDLFTLHAPRARAAVKGSLTGPEVPPRRAAWLVKSAQTAAEAAGVRVRRATFDADRQLDQTLGFAGALK